jgi:hypothetical protein
MTTLFLYKSDSGLYADAEYFFGERGEDDLAGEDEMKGYFIRAGYWIAPKTLVVSARYDVLETGLDATVETKQTAISASYWVGGKFSGTLEYASRETDNSDYEPTALRLRLQVKF